MNISLIHNVYVHKKFTEEKDLTVCLLFPIVNGTILDYNLFIYKKMLFNRHLLKIPV